MSNYWRCPNCKFFNEKTVFICRKCNRENEIEKKQETTISRKNSLTGARMYPALPKGDRTAPVNLSAPATTEFLSSKEAAALVMLTPRALGNLRRNKSLIQGVHWFRREGMGVRFDRQKLIDWVKDGEFPAATVIVQPPEESGIPEIAIARKRRLTRAEMKEYLKRALDENGNLKDGFPILTARGYFLNDGK